MNAGIIVDTCVWIEFFREPASEFTLHLKSLLRERKVIMVGMVMAEILQGVKTPKEASLVEQNLAKLPYLEITRDIWVTAGKMSSSLRRAESIIPLSDLIIAAIALSGNHEIFTVDQHFNKIDGLKLHNIA
ncbi:MAG: PIN domain-containing protein [Candidatus Moranbacteria bacterium]|jgi:predicted nucleic acid-binding protein|nr:PIN domain-containing protein [Candidatus Moranbacteria bacterium]